MQRLFIVLPVLVVCCFAMAEGAGNQPEKVAVESNKSDAQPVAPDGLHPRVKIETTLGDIILELDGEKAPVSVLNFIDYTEAGYYDGTIFHRVMKKFMIQGGGFTPDLKAKSKIRDAEVAKNPKIGMGREEATPVDTIEIKSVKVIGAYDRARIEASVKVAAEAAEQAKKLAELERKKANAQTVQMIDEAIAKATTTESGLKYVDKVVGNGPVPDPENTVSVHYTGWLTDGTKFDSSRDRGRPYPFKLQGGAIPGFLEGLRSMKVGGRRMLIIPPDLAYGKSGRPPVIPQSATLVFDVEILEIKGKTDAKKKVTEKPRPNPRVKLETTLGDFVLELDATKAPITTANFLRYVEEKYYEGTIFHSVVTDLPEKRLLAGVVTVNRERKTKGLHPPIKCEWGNGLKNRRGTIAMVRDAKKRDSAVAEFFINLTDNKGWDEPKWDGAGYAVFGKVVEGMNTIDKIASTELVTHPDYGDKRKLVPSVPVVIKTVTVLDSGVKGKITAKPANSGTGR